MTSILLQAPAIEGNIYAIIAPIALAFMALEIGLNWYYKKGLVSFQEAIANFATAIGNQTTNVLVAAGVFVVYGYLWVNFRLIERIDMNIWTYLILFLSIDFIFYWVHRWGHHINILWAAHSPHHSAEEMNFFVAVRASVTQRLFTFFFFWPLVIVGFKANRYLYDYGHTFVSGVFAPYRANPQTLDTDRGHFYNALPPPSTSRYEF